MTAPMPIETARRSIKPIPTREAIDTRREMFLAALLSGNRVCEAAKIAGISRSTAWRLQRNDDFRAALKAERDELFAGMVAGLHSAAQDCVRTLHQIAIDEKAKGSDRVLSARHAIDLLLRATDQGDLAERIGKLEQATAEQRKFGGGTQDFPQGLSVPDPNPLETKEWGTSDPLLTKQNRHSEEGGEV